jgi:hypothetical protein
MAGKESISWQRAHLVVRCACDILGLKDIPATPDLRLNLTVEEFGVELVKRYATTHPGLVFRTESSIERARLERRFKEALPKVHLRQGAPPRASQPALADGHDVAAERPVADQSRQPVH